MERFVAAADAARDAGASASAVKQIEKAAAAWNTRLAELLEAPSDVGNVSFEQLGVDYVFVDEAHAYKGLPFATSLPLPRSQSKRATDMVMKLDWLRSQHGPKVATFATGTPIANSLAEMWVLQRFLTPDGLRRPGDGGLRLVGRDVRPARHPHGAGPRRRPLPAAHPHRRVRQRPRAAHPVPGLRRPARRRRHPCPAGPGAGRRPGRHCRSSSATAELTDVIASFAERAERIRSRLVTPDEDNMLVVCNDGRLASLDLRLIGQPQPAGTGKLPAVADRVAELWVEHRHRRYRDPSGQPSPIPGALQVVFCDKGTPGGDRFNAYDELRRLLAERGLEPGRIRFIHDAGTDQAKARLFAACRHGDVDVLIGSTEKMGTGVNVQHRLVALHHVDVPWRPADIEQREGRILRQGNQNPAVHIVRYVTTGSFDPYMWGTVERKARFIAQITAPLDAADTVRSVEDLDSEVVLSYAEIKAVATGNPLIREHAEVDAEVARLSRLATNHARAQRSLPARLAGLEERIARLTATAEWLQDVDAVRVDTRGDRFVYVLPDGTRLEDRRDAGTRLRDTLARLPIGDDTWTPVGSLGGLDWEATRGRQYPSTWFEVRIVGDHRGVQWNADELYDAPAHTVMTRLERHADKIGDRLATAVRDRDSSIDQLDRGRHTLGQPFPHAARLTDLTARLAELSAALATIENVAPPPPAAQPPATGPSVSL